MLFSYDNNERNRIVEYKMSLSNKIKEVVSFYAFAKRRGINVSVLLVYLSLPPSVRASQSVVSTIS